MKLVKSLLLGSAAGLMAVTGSMAADLPSRKAAPAAEYVRVCSAYGAGFFFIPGTDTCLRVGGRVRAEYLIGETYGRSDDAYGFRARGRLNIDARTQTGYGTLRTFVRFEGTISNGTYGRGINSTGPNFNAGGRNGGAGGQSFNLDKAFIQFGGLTAGRAQSFFDFYADDLNYGPIRGSDATVNLLAYTASFGGGFSATLSLEDRSEREVGLAARPYAGQTFPDVVGVLRLEQSWGVAQLSAALHQVNTGGSGSIAPVKSDKTGFAIQGGLKFNLPMIAPGDVLWLQAAYAEGAISYLGYGGAGAGTTWGANSRVGEIAINNSDYTIGLLGNTAMTKGWAITAGFLHYWTPQIRQGIYASYSQLDYPNFIGSNPDVTEFRAGTNLIWSPVAGLDIGVEVLYAHVDPKGLVASTKTGLAKGSDDAWSGRLRIQRDF